MSLPYAFVFSYVGDADGKYKQYNLSTLAVIRSLGRRNIPVIMITTNSREGAIHSRYVKHTEYCSTMLDSEETLLIFLDSLAARYTGDKILFPTVDECAYLTGKYYDKLSDKFLIPAPNWRAISKIIDKKYQYEAAEALGIPIPETYFPKTMDEVIELSKKLINYPFVIKPNVSFEWKLKSARAGTRGKKGIQANNAEELVLKAGEVYVPGHDFMVQEVIGGRDDRLVTFIGYFDENHEPNSYFIRKKARQCPIDFGYCTMTESCHNPIVLEQSIRLLKSLNYHGIAGVEWKLDPINNTYKLIEINSRPVNTTGCAMASGVDLPAIAYFHKIGKPLQSVTSWIDGQRWAWIAMDFWTAKELIKNNKLTYRKWLSEIWTIKADAVFASDDLGISLKYYFSYLWVIFINYINKYTKNTVE